MGIKSTITLTREEVLSQYSNDQLEEELEAIDEENDNPFTNYLIEE